MRAGTAQKTQEFDMLCRNARHARRILIFVGSNDIRSANTTPDKEADRVVLNIFHIVRALWRLVHPSTRISIVDLWKRRNVTPAWEKTARLRNSRLNRLKVDVVQVAKKIKAGDLIDNVHESNEGDHVKKKETSHIVQKVHP